MELAVAISELAELLFETDDSEAYDKSRSVFLSH